MSVFKLGNESWMDEGTPGEGHTEPRDLRAVWYQGLVLQSGRVPGNLLSAAFRNVLPGGCLYCFELLELLLSRHRP